MNEPDSRYVILRDSRDEKGSRWLRAVLDASGDLILSGHDLGTGVSDSYGEGITEYEWIHRVAAPDVLRLLTCLGGQPDDDILDFLTAGIYQTLRAYQIPYTPVFSRLGD
jgi:hypothetical protein